MKLKRRTRNKQHRTFEPFHTALSQLNATIPRGIIWSDPLILYRLSIFWLVIVVSVWCNCHYFQHGFWDLPLSSWSLLKKWLWTTCQPRVPQQLVPLLQHSTALPEDVLQLHFQTPFALFLTVTLQLCMVPKWLLCCLPSICAVTCLAQPR